MRTAYSGRAAAFEKKGQYEQALADHKMAVLYFAIEAEILKGLQSEDRAKFLVETAHAYRARGKCLEALRRPQEAALDRKRAAGLEAEAKNLDDLAAKAKDAVVAAQVINDWNQPVSLSIAGSTYELQIGEQRTIPLRSPAVNYELRAGAYRAAGKLEAGKAYAIRPSSSP